MNINPDVMIQVWLPVFLTIVIFLALIKGNKNYWVKRQKESMDLQKEILETLKRIEANLKSK